MLQVALNRHPRIAIPPETAFFTMVLRSLRGQQRHWVSIQTDLGITVKMPSKRVRPGVSAKREFLRIASAYVQHIDKPSVTHFGEKSPQHQRRYRQIITTFPSAKFILIYRDGRDVAHSLARLSWMPNDLYVNFYVWLHYYKLQKQLLRDHPGRVLCVRYEDLVTAPEREFRVILDFLGLRYQPNVALGHGNREGVPDFEISYKGFALEPITSSKVGVWKDVLSASQIARLERWGGWALRDLGYQCPYHFRSMIPPWHFPILYTRIASEVIKRNTQRKIDEVFGTSYYRPNRILLESSNATTKRETKCN